MTNTPTRHEDPTDLASLRDRFPGYYQDDLQDFVTRGLVTFDTNALFDVYRFNQRARTEFLAALRLLGERLWISNRVGQELLENRSNVIKDAARATKELDANLSKHLDEAVGVIRKFGKRRGFADGQVTKLVNQLRRTQEAIVGNADQWIQFNLKGDEPPHRDPVLRHLEEVIGAKIGPLLPDTKAAESEALERFEREVPPGYLDWRKDKEKKVGDCLIWFQLIAEASKRNIPILMVTNERKADWVVKNKDDEIIAPRPELVLEMKERTGLPFQLISIQDFLVYAKQHLGATVSDSTVEQATLNSRIVNEDRRLRSLVKREGPIVSYETMGKGRSRHVRVTFESGSTAIMSPDALPARAIVDSDRALGRTRPSTTPPKEDDSWTPSPPEWLDQQSAATEVTEDGESLDQ